MYSSYLLINGQYYLSAILLIVAYFFDCLDGNFARSYNMVTEFGDYYDHVGDIIKYVVLLYALYSVDSQKLKSASPYIIIFILMCCIHLSCQELYYTNSESKTLDILKCICPANKNNVNNFLNFTRYFGCGTLHIFLFFLIISFKK